jgi:hypothetical protein
MEVLLEMVFYDGPCRGVRGELEQEYAVGREPPFREDMNTEAEESPLLEPLPGNY